MLDRIGILDLFLISAVITQLKPMKIFLFFLVLIEFCRHVINAVAFELPWMPEQF